MLWLQKAAHCQQWGQSLSETYCREKSWFFIRMVWNPEESIAENRRKKPVFLSISILPDRIL
jgi:hypothetical protein